jgi:type IV pilus assembly protein PilB
MDTQINSTHMQTGEALLQQMLLQKNLFTSVQLEKVVRDSLCFKQTLFQRIVQYQLIDSEKFLDACAQFFQLQTICINQKKLSDLPTENFPDAVIKNNLLLPAEITNGHCVVAISNPSDVHLIKTLTFQMNLSIEMRLARYDVLYRLHNNFMGAQLRNMLSQNEANCAQIVTHALLSDAIHRKASDIHFEPYQQHLRVRFRIDGLLHEIFFLPNNLSDAVISCLKVLANLDIAIKRMPQDGRLTFHSYLGFFKDCRVSTCPTIYGEKMVIRLLDANTQIRPIEKLGLQSHDQKIILDALAKPQGMILVTGPTGSGKTITLYTLLNLLNQSHRNITTIEDPVEMHIEGINQTAINTKTGLSFSSILRALLRQDPDVIMIGEIRDQETVEMAIRAAQTGHLVLSTVHTNTAPEAITRLLHMGIAPHQLCSALTLVIAQRLVRKLCEHCEHGCINCTNGFDGRIGIFELMPINEVIQTLILNNASHLLLDKTNRDNGHFNLWESALISVENNFTSLSEIYRVIPQKEMRSANTIH